MARPPVNPSRRANGWPAQWWIAVSLAVILFLWVNPALAAAVLIAGLMVFMGERRWWLIIALPAVLITGTWALFTQVLGTAIG